MYKRAGSNPTDRTMANMDNSATIPFGATSDAVRTDSTGSARRPIYAELGAATHTVRPDWANRSTQSVQYKLGRILNDLIYCVMKSDPRQPDLEASRW